MHKRKITKPQNIATLTELITVLQKIKEEHGDVPVLLVDPDTNWLMGLKVWFSKEYGVGFRGSYADVITSSQAASDTFFPEYHS